MLPRDDPVGAIAIDLGFRSVPDAAIEGDRKSDRRAAAVDDKCPRILVRELTLEDDRIAPETAAALADARPRWLAGGFQS